MNTLLGYLVLLLVDFSFAMSPIYPASETLANGDTLYQEGYLRSTNDAYYAIMQRDGNFVVYTSRDFSPVNAQWSSNSDRSGEQPYRLIMLDSGNLVIRDVHGKQIWSTNTAGKGAKPHHLIMQIDRNLVLYDGYHRPIWASNTTKW